MEMETFRKCLMAWVLLASAHFAVFADVLDNWTTNQITTNSFGFHHVVFGNGIYVAVGEVADSGGFYTSTDGLHWKLQYSEPNSWGVTLNYSGGRFASVGPSLGSGVADVSSDGTNWTTTLFPYFGNGTFNAITFGNGLYVIVGSTNSVAGILTSPDGVNWTSEVAGASPGGPLNSVAYGTGKFVAIGSNDGFEYTRSSVTGMWTKRNITGGNKISYANGLFFVSLNNKTNLLSTDGINWSQNATSLTNMLGAVTHGNGVYVAQCGISSAGSYFATSADGTNWFQYPNLLPNSCAIYDTADFDVSVATDGAHLVTGYSVLTQSFGFNTFMCLSDPLVSIRLTNSPTPKVVVSGLVGRNYQIQSTDALEVGINWRASLAFNLTNTPLVWKDSSATNSARFYRGVLLP